MPYFVRSFGRLYALSWRPLAPREVFSSRDQARSFLERVAASDHQVQVLHSVARSDPSWSGRRLDRSEVIASLTGALCSARLFVRADPEARPTAPPKRPSSQPPAKAHPPPSSRPEPTWFELRVVDELGEPIADVPVTMQVAGEHACTTAADGSARIDDVADEVATAQLTQWATIKELVRGRWDLVREGEWLSKETDRTLHSVHGDRSLDVTLLSATPHTVVLLPWVVRARLLGMFFDTNKCFLLPKAIPTIHRLQTLLEQHPGSQVLIVGHTDATGEPYYNDPLSLERAESVSAYLRDDVDAWLAWYAPGTPLEKRWGAREDLGMIESLDDYPTPPPAKPVRWYQQTRQLTVDGIAGPETRRRLIEEYMAHAALPAGMTLATHGCGESFPADEPIDTEPSSQAFQRRVELYLFDGQLGVQPPAPGAISKPGSPEYPEWKRRVQETHDFELGRVDLLHIRLHDDASVPMPHAEAQVSIDAREQLTEADAEGWIRIELPPACPQSALVRWGRPPESEDFLYERSVVVDCAAGSDEHSLRSMLHNIGYDRVLEFAIAVKLFQSHYGVDSEPEPIGLVAGEVPPATRDRLVSIYEGTCDASMG